MWDLYRDNEDDEHQRINENPYSEGDYSWHQRRKAPIGENKTIEGVVIKLDYRENSFGIRRVMTVKTDSGWSCWGTVPRAIIDVAKGQRVRFTATLQPSDKPTFAFAKRPRNAEIIEEWVNHEDNWEDDAEARYFRAIEAAREPNRFDHAGRLIVGDFHPSHIGIEEDRGSDWDR